MAFAHFDFRADVVVADGFVLLVIIDQRTANVEQRVILRLALLGSNRIGGVLANRGREASGGAALQLDAKNTVVLRHNGDDRDYRESTAGLTANATYFISKYVVAWAPGPSFSCVHGPGAHVTRQSKCHWASAQRLINFPHRMCFQTEFIVNNCHFGVYQIGEV